MIITYMPFLVNDFFNIFSKKINQIFTIHCPLLQIMVLLIGIVLFGMVMGALGIL